MVEEFHKTYGMPVSDKPALLDYDRFALRFDLIKEELDEFVQAFVNKDIVAVADSLGDLLYVVIGAALEYGIPINLVVEEIHKSNMTKLDENGKPIYRSDGKVMKGPNYFPPNIGAIINGKNGTVS